MKQHSWPGNAGGWTDASHCSETEARPLLVLVEDVFREEEGGHGGGPAGVEGQVGHEFDEFVLGDAVVEGELEVEGELLGAVESDQGGDGDEAAIALGE